MTSIQTALAASYRLQVDDIRLHLLPEKAVYAEDLNCLLVSDVHLGKSETFQTFGIPISSTTNHDSLGRLQQLCDRLTPDSLIILGDLFHSRQALTESVIDAWVTFVNQVETPIHLIVGNHDRALLDDLEQLLMKCHWGSLGLGPLWLSHDPSPLGLDAPYRLNLCGHVHPCLRLTTKLDDLRLPCFYLDKFQHQLTLPSFGAFTGGYEISLHPGTAAYAIAEGAIVPFEG